MQSEERSSHYTAFLRSGSYPTMSALLSRRNQWLRHAGLVALAGVASSMGYLTTLWCVPMPGVQASGLHVGTRAGFVNAAPSTLAQGHLAQQPMAARPASNPANVLVGLDAAQPAANSEVPRIPARNGPPLPAAATLAPSPRRAAPNPVLAYGGTVAAGAVSHTQTEVIEHAISIGTRPDTRAASTPSVNGAGLRPMAADPSLADRKKARSSRPAGADTADANAPQLAQAEWEQTRTALIAEHVRAYDEAEHGPAPVAAPAPRAREYPSPLKPPAAVSSDRAHLNVWPLTAAANVEGLHVRGPLSLSSVRRGIDRLRPALMECYGSAAQRAGRNHFGRVTVSLMIDETGRVRSPHVEGGALPGLDGCLVAVTGRLVTVAPDTGTATASLVLNFTP